jgi:uncharacterized protein (DUF2235 family)
MRRLAMFMDGTWSTVDDNTNVWRLKSLCAPQGADGVEQLVYYEIGVNGVWGGMFDKGLDRTITEAYEWLIDRYQPADEIFIFGFSRGAFAARSLAGLISKCGLLMAGSALGVKQLYDRYRHAEAPTLWKLLENPAVTPDDVEARWLLKYSQPIKIKLVGVWDTVGALGLPFGNVPGLSRTTFGWLHTGLRLPIENAFHALAVDEHRRDFEPTLWTVRRPKDPHAVVSTPRAVSSVEQRWFIGDHANVGGGCINDLLAQIPLRWMMRKASQLGLSFKSDVDLDEDAERGHISDSYRGMLHGAYKVIRPGRLYRSIGADPRESKDGTHSTVNETIDASLFERWRADANYRPPSLADWARRKEADPAKVRRSILANDPKEVVADL